SLLPFAVEDLDVIELGGEAVGQLAGPIRGVVVDHEDVLFLVAERAQHRLEVLALVVRGGTDDGPGQLHVRIFNRCPALCPATSAWPSSWSFWPTCSRSRARPRFGCWPTAGRQLAFARRAPRSP